MSVLAELLYDSFSTSKTPVFIIMDDLYFLQQKSLIAMLMFLACSLPGSFHWARECPETLWLKYPTAIVSSMVKMFSFHNIPEIMRMKALPLKALEENNDLTEIERNNLLGDAEVSESFLRYNDISAMSIHIPRYSDAKYLL